MIVKFCKLLDLSVLLLVILCTVATAKNCNIQFSFHGVYRVLFQFWEDKEGRSKLNKINSKVC